MQKLIRHAAAVVLMLVAVHPWQFVQSQQAQQADQPVLRGYQKAPQPIADILSARPTPLVRKITDLLVAELTNPTDKARGQVQNTRHPHRQR